MSQVPLARPQSPKFTDAARRDAAQRSFDRVERLLPPLTLALLLLLAGIYLWSLVRSGVFARYGLLGLGYLPSERVLTRLGARVAQRVPEQPWRLLSCALLHAGPLHLIMNLLAVLGLGRICEAVWGPGRLMALFVGSALTGSLLSQALGVPRSVGASGAAFGLMGACLVYGWRHRGRLPEPLDQMLGRDLWRWVLLNLVIGGVFSGIIDQWAHIGGLLGGALLSLTLGARLDPLEHPRSWAGWALGGLSAGALLWTLWRMLGR